MIGQMDAVRDFWQTMPKTEASHRLDVLDDYH
jgi:hypothetical protein